MASPVKGFSKERQKATCGVNPPEPPRRTRLGTLLPPGMLVVPWLCASTARASPSPGSPLDRSVRGERMKVGRGETSWSAIAIYLSGPNFQIYRNSELRSSQYEYFLPDCFGISGLGLSGKTVFQG